MELAFVCFALVGLGLAFSLAWRDQKRRDVLLAEVLAEMDKNRKLASLEKA